MTHTQFTPACPLVELRQVSHVYEKGRSTGHTVLDKVDLTLNANEIVGLLGRSGSGKSTLLRTVAGLIEPSEGTVRFPSAPDGQANVGMVFQSFALFPWLSVLQNVEVGLEAQGVAPAIRRERALKAIDLIGLDGFENAYPKELSGGMRQRVGLARALVVDPDILLMDEPFSALDVLTAETLRTDLLDLWYEGRTPLKSILIVTHNIEEAVLMCDRILVFSSNPGRVVAEITVDLPQPRDRLDPAFRALVEDIYRRMTTRTPKAPVQEGLFAGMGMAMVLPRVSTNILAGLMEALAGSAYDGKADLPALAAELQYEADELFPIAEVLQLLRFAELEGGDLLLLPAGQAFVEADVDGRKHLFREQLLTHVPLATHIRHALETGGEAGLSARRVRDQLQTHMSETFARQTLRSVVQWGRYAEAFDYDEKADRFSLEDVV